MLAFTHVALSKHTHTCLSVLPTLLVSITEKKLGYLFQVLQEVVPNLRKLGYNCGRYEELSCALARRMWFERFF